MKRTVLVTGGNKGIGFYTAQKFLACGDSVIIAGRNAKRLEAACQSLGLPQSSFVVWDVSDENCAEERLEEASRIYGAIDVFCNNAGVLTEADWKNDFFQVTPDAWDMTINTNLKGLFFACQGEANYFIRQKRKGHIVNVCSELSFRGVYAPYGISKWGARGLTAGLGKLLGRYGITVNGVAPGSTATGMVHWDEKQGLDSGCPRGVMAKPEEIAELIYFLAGADNIVGEIVVSDGGSRLH